MVLVDFSSRNMISPIFPFECSVAIQFTLTTETAPRDLLSEILNRQITDFDKMPLIDMIGTEFQSKKYDQPLIVRNDPRDSEFMRRWWAFKEWLIDCNYKNLTLTHK